MRPSGSKMGRIEVAPAGVTARSAVRHRRPHRGRCGQQQHSLQVFNTRSESAYTTRIQQSHQRAPQTAAAAPSAVQCVRRRRTPGGGGAAHICRIHLALALPLALPFTGSGAGSAAFCTPSALATITAGGQAGRAAGQAGCGGHICGSAAHPPLRSCCCCCRCARPGRRRAPPRTERHAAGQVVHAADQRGVKAEDAAGQQRLHDLRARFGGGGRAAGGRSRLVYSPQTSTAPPLQPQPHPLPSPLAAAAALPFSPRTGSPCPGHSALGSAGWRSGPCAGPSTRRCPAPRAPRSAPGGRWAGRRREWRGASGEGGQRLGCAGGCWGLGPAAAQMCCQARRWWLGGLAPAGGRAARGSRRTEPNNKQKPGLTGEE